MTSAAKIRIHSIFYRKKPRKYTASSVEKKNRIHTTSSVETKIKNRQHLTFKKNIFLQQNRKCIASSVEKTQKYTSFVGGGGTGNTYQLQ